MYRLERPSMALNDPRVAGGGSVRRYQMWNTWDIQQNESRQHIINWVAQVARGAPGGKLKNLVLSCHGLPGYLQLGEGFNVTHLALFAGWHGLVEKIWLPNCLVARIPDAAMQAQMNRDYPGWGVSDGNVFCSSLAKQVQCYVVAATETQLERPVIVPMDMMTSFEGLVLSYGPGGNVTWSSRNPSTFVPD
jgi:hypothetical protein